MRFPRLGYLCWGFREFRSQLFSEHIKGALFEESADRSWVPPQLIKEYTTIYPKDKNYELGYIPSLRGLEDLGCCILCW